MTEVIFFRLPHGEGIALPSYETAGSAGMDVRAAVGEDAPLILAAGARALVPTGFVMAAQQGYEIQVRPRSGLALKYGVTCLNTPGTIDSDYRGEVHILLINHGDTDFEIRRGMRIAQLVTAPVTQAKVIESDTMPEATRRGAGGFGSTGT
jgi:dUTP pyrophosphatase